jgi:hypothetical protein
MVAQRIAVHGAEMSAREVMVRRPRYCTGSADKEVRLLPHSSAETERAGLGVAAPGVGSTRSPGLELPVPRLPTTIPTLVKRL